MQRIPVFPLIPLRIPVMRKIPENQLDLTLNFFEKMYEQEYQDLVLAEFDRQKTARLLPPELLSPTPGGLKALCLTICESRFDPKDELMLQSFFRKKENAVAYRLAIQNETPDPFRPLTKFLRDRNVKTTFRNIGLLAWLIDFEPRPFHPDLAIPPSKPFKQPAMAPVPAGDSKRKSRVLLLILTVMICIAGYYLFKKTGPQLTGNEGCMVWNDDHYQPIDCKSAIHPVKKIDQRLVNNFKKIKEPDTLTPYSIRKVFYAKYNGRIEFFTDSGLFPLDSTRRVLPMTSHILEKYIYHIKN